MTLAVTDKARRLKREGVDVVSLSAGEPDFDTPEFVKEAAVEALRNGATKYTDTAGIPELKAAIRDKLRRDNELDYAPEQIVVSCGAKHSIYNLLQVLVQEGDEVVIQAPYWTSYPDMVALAGAKPVVVRTTEESGFRMNPREFADAITSRTRAFIYNSPSNPTGSVYPAELVREIAEIAARKGIAVISDEIYESFTYDGARHASPVAAHPKMRELGIVVNGVSKAYAMTGWRIGYAAGPTEIMKACNKLQSQITSNPTAVAQYAAAAALRGDPAVVRSMVGEYQRRRDHLLRRLGRLPGLRCRKPDGAFYLFVNVAAQYGGRLRGSVQWAEALLERKAVAVVPGAGFGDDDYVRLSYASSTRNLDEAFDRIEAFCASL
jgi:aspartate aminotransferase